jgi:sugar phosphate isomerase/epimerase
MYFSMDDIGDENLKILLNMQSESGKWQLISKFASEFGFTGIQISPMYQDKFGLSLIRVPDYVRKSFRLTYHPGGVYQLNTAAEELALHSMLSESLDIGVESGSEDVSFHPPIIADVSRLPLPKEDRSRGHCTEAQDRLKTVLNVWLLKFKDKGITLSLETHFTPAVFVYDGLNDFRDFCQTIPNLGVLVDVSHNFFDGYQISEQVDILKPLRITGFHLSDAITGIKLSEGTHLPIGQGHADFSSVLRVYKENDIVYGALEIKGSVQGITDSLTYFRTRLGS